MFPGQLGTEGELGYWPGCDAVDKGAGDIAAAMALFERVGLEDVKIVDAQQTCAGYPLLAAGHRDLFRWHAGRVAASLRGFRKVAINCSACLYAMRTQYAAEGVNLRAEIVSLADILAPAAQNLSCSLTRRSVYYQKLSISDATGAATPIALGLLAASNLALMFPRLARHQSSQVAVVTGIFVELVNQGERR